VYKGRPCVFLSCSERFKERVAWPLKEGLDRVGVYGVIVADEPHPAGVRADPGAKVDFFLSQSDALVALCTPDDRLDDRTVQPRQNIIDEMQRAWNRDHLATRVQTLKERTVRLPTNINPTYDRLDLDDPAANLRLVLRQLAEWGVLLAPPVLREMQAKAEHAGQVLREMQAKAEQMGALVKARDRALQRADAAEAARDHKQRAGPIREGLTAVPDLKAAPRREDCYAVGIELRPYQFTAVLINGSGELLGQVADHLGDMEPGIVVSALTAAIREIASHIPGPESSAAQVALGVQLGGPVDTETGTVHYLYKYSPRAPRRPPFKWENFPLGPRLQRETRFQTVILNDALAFAERERWFGVGRQTGDFVVMLIREGVDGAIVSNGQNFRGPMEIGQFITSYGQLRQSDAEISGALESAGGGAAIAAMAAEATGRNINDLETAIDVAKEDGTGRNAVFAFKAAGIAVATGLAYLVVFAGPTHVVLYTPEHLVRSGGRAADAFLEEVSKFRATVALEAHRNCELVIRPTGINDGAHGVALAALRRCFQLEPTVSSIGAGPLLPAPCQPTLIAAARSQMTASSPRGTFSQAELAGDRVITRCITPPMSVPGATIRAMPGDLELLPTRVSPAAPGSSSRRTAAARSTRVAAASSDARVTVTEPLPSQGGSPGSGPRSSIVREPYCAGPARTDSL
jgi:glucokinase